MTRNFSFTVLVSSISIAAANRRDGSTRGTVFELKKKIPAYLTIRLTPILRRGKPNSEQTRAGRLATLVLTVVVAVGLTLAAGQGADRVAAIHQQVVFADMHAHPSHFHRENVSRIEPDELARYRRGLMDIVVCSISTDGAFSGGYVKRDGTEVKRGELQRPRPGGPFAFTLDRFARITRTIDDEGRGARNQPGSFTRRETARQAGASGCARGRRWP